MGLWEIERMTSGDAVRKTDSFSISPLPTETMVSQGQNWFVEMLTAE